MGRDAKVDIWVGVRSADVDIDEITEKLPDGLLDEYGDSMGRSKKYDLCVQSIRSSEDVEGFGVVVFNHDWDFGSVEFNVHEIERKIDDASEKLQALFDERGIDAKIGVWCQTDFS